MTAMREKEEREQNGSKQVDARNAENLRADAFKTSMVSIGMNGSATRFRWTTIATRLLDTNLLQRVAIHLCACTGLDFSALQVLHRVFHFADRSHVCNLALAESRESL